MRVRRGTSFTQLGSNSQKWSKCCEHVKSFNTLAMQRAVSAKKDWKGRRKGETTTEQDGPSKGPAAKANNDISLSQATIGYRWVTEVWWQLVTWYMWWQLLVIVEGFLRHLQIYKFVTKVILTPMRIWPYPFSFSTVKNADENPRKTGSLVIIKLWVLKIHKV